MLMLLMNRGAYDILGIEAKPENVFIEKQAEQENVYKVLGGGANIDKSMNVQRSVRVENYADMVAFTTIMVLVSLAGTNGHGKLHMKVDIFLVQ